MDRPLEEYKGDAEKPRHRASCAPKKAAPDDASRTDGPRPHGPGTIPTPPIPCRVLGRGQETNSRRKTRTMNEHSQDPYEVLHLGPAATAGDVTRAYRALMRTHHPDTTGPDAVPAERESRAQELHEIMGAYTVLGDPVKRAAHDRQQQRPSLPEPGAPNRPRSFSGAVLIIGPVRWESPSVPAHGPAASGPPNPSLWTLTGSRTELPAAPGGYRVLWWIHR